MSEFGAWIDDNMGTVLSNPAFTPMVLTGVVDIPGVQSIYDPQNPATVATGVPASKKCVVYYRGTRQNDLARNLTAYELFQSGGMWHVRFRLRTDPVRLYIFSNQVPKIPDWGIYFYANGEIIYHQNCLPLAAKTWDIRQAFNYPRGRILGTLSASVSTEYEDPDTWGQPSSYARQWYAGAGWINYGSISEGYKWGVKDLATPWMPVTDTIGPRIAPFTANIFSYIEAQIYDNYYRQSLGI